MARPNYFFSRASILIFSQFATGMMVPKGQGEIRNPRIFQSTAKFLTFEDGVAALCTGTYLKATKILTEAHCVPSKKNDDQRLLLLKVDQNDCQDSRQSAFLLL